MPDLKKLITLEALQAALPSWLKSLTKPSYNADEISDNSTVNKFVTETDKANWNAKGTYSKPSDGIPKSDLSSLVQASLDNADSALQFETDPTVPTWAKQPNKPSYTQDEVPDGSTYKRVSSTEKSAWNGKQNALSTTQMQAVNSGITSEKVGQISTNQTNILYGLNTGVKNLLVITPTATINGLTSVQQSDGYTVKITGTPTGGKSIRWSDVIKITESGTYKVKLTLSGTSASCYLYDVTTSTVVHEYYSSNTYDETLTANHEYAMYTYSSSTVDATISAMLCTAAAYAQSTDFIAPALPNSDLTYLEAEDRAALAEVVDSGAKNLLSLPMPISSWAYDSSVFTISESNGEVTVSKTASSDIKSIEIYLTTPIKTNTYLILSGCPSGGGVNSYLLDVWDDGTFLASDEGSGSVPNKFSTNTQKLRIRFATGAFSNIKFKPMICTKAAFGVSKAFVPYRYDPYTTVWQNVANATLYARRNDRTVTINGYVDNLSFTSGTALTLGTINDEIGKPVQQIRALCNIGSNAYSIGEVAYLTVGTDGQLKVTPKTYSGTGAVFLSFAYAF